jgi:hypothetical protein
VVRTPFGSFNLAGVTKDQLTRQSSSFEKASAPYRRAGLTGESAAAYQRLIAGYNPNPRTREELAANDQLISQLNANAAVLISPAQMAGQMGAETKGYAKSLNDLLTGKQSDLGAAVALRGLRHEEKGLTERYGHTTDVPLNNLEPYDQEISKIDELLTSETPEGVPKEKEQMIADRKQAAGLARDVMSDLKNPVSQADEAKEFNAASRIIANLRPSQQGDSEKVANAIQDVAPHLAQRIRENGLQFGGFRAEARLTQLLGKFKEMANATPAAKELYVQSLVAAGKLAGIPVKLTADDIASTDPMLALKLKQAGLNITKTAGEIREQPFQHQERMARLNEIVARTEAIKNKPQAAASAKGLLTQNAQLRVDTAGEAQAYSVYFKTLKEHGLDQDENFDVLKPRAGNKDDAAAAAAYQGYLEARRRTQGTLQQMNQMLPKERRIKINDAQWNPITGARDTTAPAATSAAPAAAKTGVPTQQQLRQQYYSGLKKSGATDHEINVLMQHRFGATP